MRLPEVERGDTFGSRALIGLISVVSGMRLPDEARVAFYDKDFLDGALGRWTQHTMRGPSPWSISERELMAAVVARWNACSFCTGAHRAIAIKGMPQATVDAALADYTTAGLSPGLTATLRFLETMTRKPEALTSKASGAVLAAGVSREALTDVIAASLFAMVTRYADALEFAIPWQQEFDKAAEMLLKRGYG